MSETNDEQPVLFVDNGRSLAGIIAALGAAGLMADHRPPSPEIVIALDRGWNDDWVPPMPAKPKAFVPAASLFMTRQQRRYAERQARKGRTPPPQQEAE